MYNWRDLRDRLFLLIVVSMSLLALFINFHLIFSVVYNGIRVVSRAGLGFLVDIPPTPLSREIGGIAPSLVGSLAITAISLPITVTIAFFTSILTLEYPRNPLSRLADIVIRAYTSIPTIMVSMVVYQVVVVAMRKFSLIAGSIALTLISLPYAYTSFTTALRSVPRTYREAAYAIGMTRWKTVILVITRISKRALLVGLLLTLARSMGETAALLFTIGRYRAGVSIDPFSPIDAIPLLIFDYITSPFKIYHEVAWGAAFILFSMYIALFTASKLVVKEVKI